jgi:hypothetical protein
MMVKPGILQNTGETFPKLAERRQSENTDSDDED